jgi:uncharacterized protein YdhG (YjbR/CyaY superfamily)
MMPSFKYYGMLAYFALFKDHYSLFVSPKIKDAFTDKLSDYKQTKSAIHFKFDKPIPTGLIAEIISYAASVNHTKSLAKKTRKKKH